MKVRGQFHQHVYLQFLQAQIPKAQKRQSTSHKCLFALLESAHIKAACKKLVKSTPDRECVTSLNISKYLNE